MISKVVFPAKKMIMAHEEKTLDGHQTNNGQPLLLVSDTDQKVDFLRSPKPEISFQDRPPSTQPIKYKLVDLAYNIRKGNIRNRCILVSMQSYGPMEQINSMAAKQECT